MSAVAADPRQFRPPALLRNRHLQSFLASSGLRRLVGGGRHAQLESQERTAAVLGLDDAPHALDQPGWCVDAEAEAAGDRLGGAGGLEQPREQLVAPTGELGVELAREQQPALIIMDINLPGMSGLEAMQTLQSLPGTAHIPVIALSAAASERDKQRGLQAGFAAYLTKPVDVEAFISTVEKILQA